MKFLKKFTEHTDYDAYINSDTKILPNVSYCKNNNELHYNALFVENRIVATFNVEGSGTQLTILTNVSLFSEIEIDGVVQPSVVSNYTFDTEGEHTVKYTLIDPTTIGKFAFQRCRYMTSVNIPDNVINISEYAFSGCSRVTTVKIGNGVENIYDYAFQTCIALNDLTLGDNVTSIHDTAFEMCGIRTLYLPRTVSYIGTNAFSNNPLTTIILYAVNPPHMGEGGAFSNTNISKIYVPAESVETYKITTGWFEYETAIEPIE